MYSYSDSAGAEIRKTLRLARFAVKYAIDPLGQSGPVNLREINVLGRRISDAVRDLGSDGPLMDCVYRRVLCKDEKGIKIDLVA
jgi:hypothetical protein